MNPNSASRSVIETLRTSLSDGGPDFMSSFLCRYLVELVCGVIVPDRYSGRAAKIKLAGPAEGPFRGALVFDLAEKVNIRKLGKFRNVRSKKVRVADCDVGLGSPSATNKATMIAP